MKTVSSDNLARFKAKCDETYQKKGSGGITNAEVIEYAEELPTASETSPNFVQTPDGVLYRKKAVEGGSLLGTWTFNQTISLPTESFSVSFTLSYNGLQYDTIEDFRGQLNFRAGNTGQEYVAYNSRTNTWTDGSPSVITITDISSLTNVDEFTQWLTANATGGGASVSYEYVAMQEVPTPTTADNGKVLGVANGAYALQEASGGVSRYSEIFEGASHSTQDNTITFDGNIDISQYSEFYIYGEPSDADGTSFLMLSAYVPLITGISFPVLYRKTISSGNTEQGIIYGDVWSFSNSSFNIIIRDVPAAPDGNWGPSYKIYAK